MPSESTGPLVSVVVPVYNTAPYLAQCLQSIVAQTWSNWECVVVDNRSTDGGLTIAQEYARQDSRIRVVSADQFRPVAANFNYALGFCDPASTYTKMVLSDDFIFPTCLDEMVRVGERHPSVGVIGAYRLAGDRVLGQGLPYPADRVEGRTLRRMHFLSWIQVFGSQTSVMYRSEAVRRLAPFFDEESLASDRDVCLRILREYDFGFVHQVLTFTRTDNESITSGIVGFKPYGLHSLILLHKYGREVLSPSEYEACWKRAQRDYFRFLGVQALRGREPAFWNYHSRGLEAIGYRLTAQRRARLASVALLDAMGNPKASIERLARRIGSTRRLSI